MLIVSRNKDLAIWHKTLVVKNCGRLAALCSKIARIKFWQIGRKPPNPLKFSTAKFLCHNGICATYDIP